MADPRHQVATSPYSDNFYTVASNYVSYSANAIPLWRLSTDTCSTGTEMLWWDFDLYLQIDKMQFNSDYCL